MSRDTDYFPIQELCTVYSDLHGARTEITSATIYHQIRRKKELIEDSLNRSMDVLNNAPEPTLEVWAVLQPAAEIWGCGYGQHPLSLACADFTSCEYCEVSDLADCD